MEKAGEVIQTATDRFVAQSYRLNYAPPFGSLVRAPQGEGTTIYAVVTSIETSPLDPARKPLARGQEAGSLAEIYREHPQIPELFRTQFTATVVGHAQGGSLRHYLPPLPPEVHQLVYLCPPEEVRAFTQELTFLPLLLGSDGPGGAPEVTAAFLRYANQARGAEGADFLVQAGKHLVVLLRGEPVRLASLLTRLR